MKVTYIYHSSFMVELSHTVLIFDYFKGVIPEFNKNKDIYVFSSHKHHDHFSLEIFKIFKDNPKVKFILSNDIKLNDNYLEKNEIDLGVKERIVNIRANQSKCMDEIRIKTLKSTDLGVAFCVEAEGKSIYHAGDLNWWHWSEESDDYNINMERQFKKNLKGIENHTFDLAFLPVDARQEDYFWWGFDYFMKHTNTKIVFPMHFWEDYTVIDRLEKIAIENGYDSKLHRVKGDGQEWEIQI